MNTQFVLAGSEPEPKKIVSLELVQDSNDDFNIVATLPTGAKAKLVGVRRCGDKLRVVRWSYSGLDAHPASEYADFDCDGRIRDMFR